jgi:hypothetical protein
MQQHTGRRCSPFEPWVRPCLLGACCDAGAAAGCGSVRLRFRCFDGGVTPSTSISTSSQSSVAPAEALDTGLPAGAASCSRLRLLPASCLPLRCCPPPDRCDFDLRPAGLLLLPPSCSAAKAASASPSSRANA